MTDVDWIDFKGYVNNGIGNFATGVKIPSRFEYPDGPDDWPDRLEPGTLNVLICAFPEGLQEIRQLDDGIFTPAIVIPRSLIGGNSRGDGQAWRAELRSAKSDEIADNVWVFRRIGSKVGKQLEIVADRKLRDVHELDNDQVLIVRMFGRWNLQ